ncbi:DoxX family protein [bacterium]|nr:DoxX family protein [bacterium]
MNLFQLRSNPTLPAWLDWGLRILPAVLLMQSLYFKFTAQPVSVQLFTTIGMEPWGRIGIGVQELIVGILYLIPAFAGLGALGAAGLMAGAIGFHLFTPLGIAIALPDGGTDGGELFGMAVLIFVLSLANVYFHRRTIPIIGNRL